MIKKILSLFFILITVWVGLCSAQTTAKKYYLLEGLFFDGMPPCVSADDSTVFIIHKDEEGNKVTELRSRKGSILTEAIKKYATPAEEVPNTEAFLKSYCEEMGLELPMSAVRTLNPEEWLGKSFPAFKVKDTEGKEWSNADVAGRPMVLNFWYTGCGPCIREMPVLNQWMELYPDVTYLATTFDSADKIKKIVENRPFRFIQIADERFFFDVFHVSGMPVTILTDKKGIIRHIEEGTGTAKLRYMQDLLKELAEE